MFLQTPFADFNGVFKEALLSILLGELNEDPGARVGGESFFELFDAAHSSKGRNLEGGRLLSPALLIQSINGRPRTRSSYNSEAR